MKARGAYKTKRNYDMSFFINPQTPEDKKEKLKFRKQLDQIYESYHPNHNFILLTDDVMVRTAYQNMINPIK